MAEQPRRPTRAEVEASVDKTVRDVIAPGLKVLFCGINPGLYTAAVGHHFARPGNRFWPTLHLAGYTERELAPHEERELLPLGYGITNVVARATRGAAEISREEFTQGGKRLESKVLAYHPRYLAVLGIGAYRKAFQRRNAHVGPQPDHRIGETKIWVLPNPSGLNAHYQLDGLAALFRELRLEAEEN